MRIAVIGGGIAGLNAAQRLGSSGHDVTLFESSDQLGGLGTFFQLGDRFIDRFYHCIMPKDDHMLGLIDRLGISDRLYWNKTYMGMIYRSNYYPFNSPVDLLRFSELSLFARLRLGAGTILMPRVGDADALDDVPIEQWLTGIFGKSLWEAFWRPLFAAKFGDAVDKLPALYLRARLGRESNVSDRGYLEGGLKGMIDTLAENIRTNGGHIHTERPIGSIEAADSGVTIHAADGESLSFDAAISTVPVTILRRLLRAPEQAQALPNVPHQGVVNALFLTRRPMSGNYWTPVIFSGAEFDGVVESSTLIKPEHYGGLHATYVMRYTGADSELFNEPEDTIKARWAEQFLAVHRHLDLKPDDIADVHVFKAPFVEPLYPLGYQKLKPPFELVPGRLYSATTGHVYPGITSWNSSIGVSDACLEHAGLLEERQAA